VVQLAGFDFPLWGVMSGLVGAEVQGIQEVAFDDLAVTEWNEAPLGESGSDAWSVWSNFESVEFTTVDGVLVSASYGMASGAGARPVVILVHEVGSNEARYEWLSVGIIEALLDAGYGVLALDLRGHGGSSLPADGRTDDVLLVEDLENYAAQHPLRRG
jgi:pimeloyl-ACP methyl ester carboxylesterase